MEVREGLLYTESHEWVKEEGNSVTIGISDYAQCQMKDVVFVEMPEVGAEFKKGDSIGVVESVKTVADIYSPVSGKVTETNLALKDHPQFINEDPFGKGWIVKIAVRDKSELKGMLSAKDYKKSLPED
jgi:glycine cleavage system H protein